MGKCEVVVPKRRIVIKRSKNKAQRLRRLARENADDGRIKQIKDRRGTNGMVWRYR